MEKTKLSAVVKALRKEYGLTQEDLAMKSGVGLCFVRLFYPDSPRHPRQKYLLTIKGKALYSKIAQQEK
jgi:transcriptional regulator with XRE-family HTH domain